MINLIVKHTSIKCILVKGEMGFCVSYLVFVSKKLNQMALLALS